MWSLMVPLTVLFVLLDTNMFTAHAREKKTLRKGYMVTPDVYFHVTFLTNLLQFSLKDMKEHRKILKY